MVQMTKSTKSFELFESSNTGSFRIAPPKSSKYFVLLSTCAIFILRNYSARASTVALVPIKQRLCRAKRGGNINYSPKILHPRSVDDKKE